MTSARPRLALVLALLLLVAAAAAALSWGGAAGVGAGDAWRVLWGSAPRDADAALVRALVFDVRLPRLLLLALAGAALAAAGAALQACLQNPLVDPGLLGLSGGAALGAVAAYVTQLADRAPFAVPLCAFGGALGALALVYLIAHAAGRPTAGVLLLTGVAMGSLASSLVSVLLLATGQHRVHEIFAWLLGSAGAASMQQVALAAPPVLLGLAGLFAARRTIDALALGEENALSVGVDVTRARLALFALVALAAGGAVSVVGPIAFVGLMVPHAVRGVAGPAARGLLPAAAIAGAGFLVACDLVARVAGRAVDVPVGVVTALMGVPFFLVLLRRAARA